MTRPCLHLICNAHLDPVWQWRWEEGCAETISTFRSAIQLLREYPDLIFNHNEAVLYQWIKEYTPELFKEIQSLVKEGRWAISGGWYLQPDVNLPGTESIIRQIQMGRDFFHKYFKTQPMVAYNFDSFGHSGGLPQILCLAGYKMYMHMRPQADDMVLPSDLYRWRGVDGSEILGYRIAVGLYHTEYDNLEQRLIEGRNLALKLDRDVPIFWGLGNHGGGATRKDLAVIDAFRKKEKQVDMIHSTPDRFYLAVKEQASQAPLIARGLQKVFTGCYTSLSRLKRTALKSLHLLVQTEALRAASWWLYQQEYPVEELNAAWCDHLFNDFHDIITGACIEPAEQDTIDRYGRAMEQCRELRLEAMVCLANQMDASNGILLVVMNTNPGLTQVPVEVECMLAYRPKWSGTWHLALHNADGSQILCQEEQPEALLPFNGWRRKLSFMAELLAVGAAQYSIKVHNGGIKYKEASPAFKFNLNRKTGFIEELETKNGDQCLSGHLLQPLVIDDRADSWGTGEKVYRKITGKFRLEPGSFGVKEKGPIRTIFQAAYFFNHSKINKDIISYSQWPVLEYRIQIYWNEIQKRLKLSIPTVFDTDSIECEILGGMISREADGEEQVHGRWLLIKEEKDGHDAALGIVTSGQHGFDFKSGEVRLSVLRSAAYCHERGFKLGPINTGKFMDIGQHDIRILITAGSYQSIKQSLPGLADWLNSPPYALAHLPTGNLKAKNPGPDSPTNSQYSLEFLSSFPSNVRLLACKQSLDGNALIIRLQESIGDTTHFSLKIHPFKSPIELSLKPLEIKTIRIEKNGTWKETDLIEKP
ncbi:MAG: hypothetical protein JW755_13530 [Candidatus Aminicenantes bacterium]|nr:hypothetical protein [Candidatus Aminicenantes bacterium]